ncbi:uncharacterized protein PF3D7_1120000-like [Palaemon carinicauda]|uniref:uncharacterized protein PF3D7_1120000-like n=1 Tax=Palaemon carinicauda TaxID=392227 RepID=UPI0035B67216
MFQGMTVADYILRKRRKKEILKRFEHVEEQIRERDPELYEEFSKLREDIKNWDSDAHRSNCHSGISRVNNDKEEDFTEIEQEADQEGELKTENDTVSEEETKVESCPETDQVNESMIDDPTKEDGKEEAEEQEEKEEGKEESEEQEEKEEGKEKEAVEKEGAEEETEVEKEEEEGEAETRLGIEGFEDELAEDIEMMLEPHCNPPMLLGKNQKLKYKPRLNVVWQQRLEASQKEREERLKETEAATQPSTQALMAIKNKAYASVPCRIYEKQPKQSRASPVQFTQELMDLDLIDNELGRRKSFPLAHASIQKDSQHLSIDCKIEPRGNRSSELRFLKSTALKAADTDLNQQGLVYPLPRTNNRHAISETYSHNVSSTQPFKRSNTVHFGEIHQYPIGTTAKNKTAAPIMLSLKPIPNDSIPVNSIKSEIRRINSLAQQGPRLVSQQPASSSVKPIM